MSRDGLLTNEIKFVYPDTIPMSINPETDPVKAGYVFQETKVNETPILKKVESQLKIRPITYKNACSFIKTLHRHHGIPQGHKISISCYNRERCEDGLFGDWKLVGVATIGRPTGRYTDKGDKVKIGGIVQTNVLIAEVTRLCTDGTPNACSKLYGACRRLCKEMGYDWVITYILDTEGGYSLQSAGWHKDKGKFGGKSWSVPSRPRKNKSPEQLKFRYYSHLNNS